MQVGGNQSLRSFFEEHGISNDATIREKYSSPAAALYREMYLLACSTPYSQHQSEDPRRRTSDRAPCRLCRLIRRNPARSPSFQIRRRRFGKPGKFPRVFSSLQGFGSTPVTASNDSNAPNSSNSSKSSKSATAAKRAALPAVVRSPPRFWRVSGRRRSRSRRVLPAGNSSFFQKYPRQRVYRDHRKN